MLSEFLAIAEKAKRCLRTHSVWAVLMMCVFIAAPSRPDSNLVIQKAVEMTQHRYASALVPIYNATIFIVDGAVYINPIITQENMLGYDGVPNVISGYRNDLHWKIHHFHLKGHDSKYLWVHLRAALKKL